MEKESMVKEFKKPSVKTYKGSIYPLRIFNESKKLFAQRYWFIRLNKSKGRCTVTIKTRTKLIHSKSVRIWKII